MVIFHVLSAVLSPCVPALGPADELRFDNPGAPSFFKFPTQSCKIPRKEMYPASAMPMNFVMSEWLAWMERLGYYSRLAESSWMIFPASVTATSL
jgi:hypothetical protein